MFYRGRIDVEVLPVLEGADTLMIRAQVTGLASRAAGHGPVFFQVPAELRPWLAVQGGADDLHDAFARALVFLAMEAKRTLFVHGRVSESLLANLGRYQEILSAALPRYRAITVRADEVVADPTCAETSEASEALMGFSGGLDSVYSLYTHQQGVAAGRSLSIPHCLFVHGFDIPLEDEAYRRAFASARQITDALNARLFLVRTNVKLFLPFWPNSHGAALAAVLSLFERSPAAGLIASSYEPDNPHVLESGYGSTPETDPWLSSRTFTVIHDTCRSRAEKSEILRAFDLGRRNLRVCWAGKDLASNCGVCSKCILQMLAMKAAGVEDLAAFKAALTPAAVRGVNLSSRAFLWQWRRIIEYAARHGRADNEFIEAMRQRADECERSAVGGGSSRPAPRRGWFHRWKHRGDNHPA